MCPVCDSYPSEDLSWDVLIHAMLFFFFWMGLNTEVLGHASINMDFLCFSQGASNHIEHFQVQYIIPQEAQFCQALQES